MRLHKGRFWKSFAGETPELLVRVISGRTLRVYVRLGCLLPENYVSRTARGFFKKKLPYREEEYPSLSVYWKIRLLT